MIRLHRLSARAEVFYLNPDLIVSIDSTPDTVLTLTTHQKVLISDTPEAVVAAIHDATGVWIHDLPATPERIMAALTDGEPPAPPGVSVEEPEPRTPPIEDLPRGGDTMPFRAPTDPPQDELP